MEFTNYEEPKTPPFVRPLSLDYVRKELQKIGNPAEELIYYVWHLSNGRKEQAQDYIKPIMIENKMRLEQLNNL